MKRIAIAISLVGLTAATLITRTAAAGIKYHAAIKYGIKY